MSRLLEVVLRLLRVLAAVGVLAAVPVLSMIVIFFRGDAVRQEALPALMLCLCALILLVVRPLRRKAVHRITSTRLGRWLAQWGLRLSRVAGRCSPGAAHLLYDSAVFLLEQCRYGEAAAKLTEAAGLFEELDDRQNQALALMELGNCENAAGRHENAVAALSKVLSLWEQLADRQREDNTWRLFNNFGVALSGLGDTDAAEGYYRRALRNCRDRYGAAQPETAMCLLNLADVHRRRKRFQQAEELLAESLEILDRSRDDNFAFGVSLLAMLHDDQGRLKEAEELYRQARQLLEKQLGPGHAEVARVLECHGTMLERGGRPKDGAALRARAASIFDTIG